MSHITLTGKTMPEVREHLGRVLPPEAYSPIKHRSHLTDINPTWLRESLTDCFGPVGIGWWTVVTRELVEPILDEYDKWYGEVRIEFSYAFYDENNQDEKYISAAITGFGGNASKYRDDVLKGAFTSALGAAAKELLWQVRVYKGEDVLKFPKNDLLPNPPVDDPLPAPIDLPAPNGNRTPLAIDELKRRLNHHVERLVEEDYAPTSFAEEEYVRAGLPKLFPDSDDAGADTERVLQFLFDGPYQCQRSLRCAGRGPAKVDRERQRSPVPSFGG